VTDERRFTEEEVAEILQSAAELEHSDKMLSRSSTGLTLSELNEIGREAGISPEALRRAVSRLSVPEQRVRTMAGLPIGVGRTVELGRTVSDAEWDRLVVLLRETFDARGVIKHEGSFRSWSNGNLQILLEPGASGHRLRMKTFNEGARILMIGGLAMAGMVTLMVVAALFKGVNWEPGFTAAIGALAASAAAMLGLGAIRLPRWARTRQQQMNEIAEIVESQSLVMMNSGAPSNS
jgi:hypothetical protein